MLRRVSRREEGSLIIAMAVMLILVTLSTAALARTLGWMTQMRNAQDYDAALGVADGAMSDALFVIDQNPDVDHHGTGMVDGAPYEWWAKRVTESEYRVEAKGMVGDTAHGVRARITRNAKFPHALFSNQDMVFNGNGTLDIYSFLGADHTPTGQAYVGSNGKIVVNSGAGAGNAQHFYGPNGGCIQCPHPVKHDAPRVLEPVEAPAVYQACPTDGIFKGEIDGGGGLAYVCYQDVVFGDPAIAGSELVSVKNGPAKIYVMDGHKVDMSGALLNPTRPAQELQIYVDGGQVTAGTGNTVTDITFSGVLYAPKTTLKISGGKWWTGAVVVDKLDIAGAPNFKLGYDQELAYYLGNDWGITRYAEIPSAEADGCIPAPTYCVTSP